MEIEIVGILGFKGSGKDTAAQALIDEGYVKFAFADALKDVIAAMFNWPRHMMEGDTKESRMWRETVDRYWARVLGIEGFTPRMAMQQIGTNVLREHFNDSIWIYNLESKILHGDHSKVVITDCRFPNEVNMVKRLGGKLLRVNRGAEPDFCYFSNKLGDPKVGPMVEKILRESYSEVHESEWAWNHIPVDTFIENDSTIEELKSRVLAAIK